MYEVIKYFALTFSIVLIIHGSYSIGTTFDDYCWYGQTIYLGSDKPPKCLTQTEHDEMFTGELWEQLSQTSFLPEGHYEDYKHPITICNSLEDCDRMCGAGKFFNYGIHTCDWDL